MNPASKGDSMNELYRLQLICNKGDSYPDKSSSSTHGAFRNKRLLGCVATDGMGRNGAGTNGA